MKGSDENMELKILECAEELFLSKGYNLTSTTEIARAAGCNQALVHYYFRTKENLFQKIYSKKIDLFVRTITITEDESLPFPDMLEKRITRLFGLLKENPRLPFMIFSEVIVNRAQRSALKESVLSSCSESAAYLERRIREEVAAGNIRQTTAMDMTLNIFSLVASFFAYLPFLEEIGVVREDNREAFLEHRKKEIIETIIKSL